MVIFKQKQPNNRSVIIILEAPIPSTIDKIIELISVVTDSQWSALWIEYFRGILKISLFTISFSNPLVYKYNNEPQSGMKHELC